MDQKPWEEKRREEKRERKRKKGTPFLLLRKMHNKEELVNIGAMTFSLL